MVALGPAFATVIAIVAISMRVKLVPAPRVEEIEGKIRLDDRKFSEFQKRTGAGIGPVEAGEEARKFYDVGWMVRGRNLASTLRSQF